MKRVLVAIATLLACLFVILSTTQAASFGKAYDAAQRVTSKLPLRNGGHWPNKDMRGLKRG